MSWYSLTASFDCPHPGEINDTIKRRIKNPLFIILRVLSDNKPARLTYLANLSYFFFIDDLYFSSIDAD